MTCRTALCFAVLALLVAVTPLGAQKVEVDSLMLDNGMEFFLVPRSDQPNVIAAGWVAKVGSVNERPGITGISHFFEHMMFKGTGTIGTSDAERDRKIIEELAATRDRLLEIHLGDQYRRYLQGEIDDPWDQSNDTSAMKTLRDRMRALQEEQRGITVKDEFDQVYTTMGGSGMNAFTSEDLTFYFINVPSNKFELWAWMESDRLKDSRFREFYAERDVVHEERRLRTESTPTGIFQEQFDAMFWQSSPYSWPVIGWTSDLNSYTRKQAEAYYDIYYRPNNLVGIVVGDFEPETVKTNIREYFGRLERGKQVPPVVTLEMKQIAEKRMYAEGDCQPQVEVRYHTVPFNNKDSFALEMLSAILNGRTGRLYKSLVEGSEVAASAACRPDHRKYAGAFSFFAECKGDATPEDLENGWYEVLGGLQKEDVPGRELQKVKNQSLANSYRGLRSNFLLLVRMGLYEARGGWEYINESPGKLQEVTAADIRRVAGKYFERSNRCVAIYTRKAGTQTDDPELAALEPSTRNMVKQMLSQLGKIEDAAQLGQIKARMESSLDQAPEAVRPGLKYILKKVQEKMDQLEGQSKN